MGCRAATLVAIAVLNGSAAGAAGGRLLRFKENAWESRAAHVVAAFRDLPLMIRPPLVVM